MNGTVVTLSFKNDTAEFCAKSKDSDAQTTIKGICFFDEKSMLIYNKNDSEPYIFEYEIKNNKLILKYGGGKLVLTREKWHYKIAFLSENALLSGVADILDK